MKNALAFSLKVKAKRVFSSLDAITHLLSGASSTSVSHDCGAVEVLNVDHNLSFFPHVNCLALDLQWVSIRFEECQCGVQLLK